MRPLPLRVWKARRMMANASLSRRFSCQRSSCSRTAASSPRASSKKTSMNSGSASASPSSASNPVEAPAPVEAVCLPDIEPALAARVVLPSRSDSDDSASWPVSGSIQSDVGQVGASASVNAGKLSRVSIWLSCSSAVRKTVAGAGPPPLRGSRQWPSPARISAQTPLTSGP